MAFTEPRTAGEIVIYRGGWGFRLPAQHRVSIDEEKQLVQLSQPDRGGIYELQQVDETASEFRIQVGDPYGISHATGTTEPPGYPFPTIDDELARLRAAWKSAGLPEHEFEAWAQGATYDSHTTHIRARLRVASQS
jgi:hypothetical protein